MRLDLGPLLRGLASFFEGSTHPDIVAAAPSVVEPLKQAAAAVQAAAPTIVTDMANAALAKVPDGALFTPVADSLILGAIDQLYSKLSGANQVGLAQQLQSAH